MIGDFDGDGVPDLATANQSDSTVSVPLGNGDGTSQPRKDFFAGRVALPWRPATSTARALDLVVTNQISSTISILFGNGDGAFEPRVLELATANEVGGSASVPLNECVPLTPQFVRQPKSVLAGPVQEPVTIWVLMSSDTPMTYQWLGDGVPLVDDAEISGSLTSDLTILADMADVGEYTCEVTNIDGTVTSIPAVLGFRPNPCPADLTGDGVLDFFDVQAFLSLFASGCP